eukprot:3095571-Prymnesium_polylepis.1
MESLPKGDDVDVDELLTQARQSSVSQSTLFEESASAAPPMRAREDTVEQAMKLNEAFDYEGARALLKKHEASTDVRARAALSACCLHMAEAALAQKNGALGKSLAIEALAHADAAKAADPRSPLGFVWYGHAISTKAKA